MKPDLSEETVLSSQSNTARAHVVAIGEVLWDLYDHSRRLGGATLNFSAHARRLGHTVSLISAVGRDELGVQAAEMIASLDLDTRFFQSTSRYPTGTAQVSTGSDGKPQFTIVRPAAYDAVELTSGDLNTLRQQQPAWFYYGTLFAATETGKEVLYQLLTGLEDARTFYDVNLRPDADSPKLVRELLLHADVVKLNEEEVTRVRDLMELPTGVEAFCREGAARFGWDAVGVTLGDRGCAIFANGDYVEAAGHQVDVVDTVGAGDAFAAAFMHGLSLEWTTAKIASFANRVGALVASRHGAIPEWTLEEAVKL